MIECHANSYRDICHCACLRPIGKPHEVVWLYFEVAGKRPGTLEARTIEPCLCGCGNLVVFPSPNLMSHQSLIVERVEK